MKFDLNEWMEKHGVIEKTLAGARGYIERYVEFNCVEDTVDDAVLQKYREITVPNCEFVFEEVVVTPDQNGEPLNRIDCRCKIYCKEQILCRYVLCFRLDGEIFDDATYTPFETNTSIG